MNHLISKLTSNNVYLIISLILIVGLAFFMFKKLIKFLIFIIIVGIAFFLYVNYKK